MVLQKRLDYGFNGYQVPVIPRGSRSARGRGSVRKKVENNQMCAFDLLATVAGKLLQEKESSSGSSNASAAEKNTQPVIVKGNVKQEQQDGVEPLNVAPCDQRRCDETVLVSELGMREQNRIYSSKDLSQYQHNIGVGSSSITGNANPLEKVGFSESATPPKKRNDFSKFLLKKEEVESGIYGESSEVKIMQLMEGQLPPQARKIGNLTSGGTMPDTGSSEDPMELDIKPPAIVSSDSSVEVPMCGDHLIPHGSFPGCWDDEKVVRDDDDKKVVSRDDDENSSGCTQPSSLNMKAFRPPPRVGSRRMRKFLASKYWKVAPKLKDGELSKSDMKFIFHNRKTSYTRQRSQKNFPFKKRKIFAQTSVFTSGGTGNEDTSNSSRKSNNNSTNGSASRASSSVSGQRSSFQSRDSHVKLSIKSFRVPELFIEISETATVGSLKRTVMEAVNAILGEGLRVGVVLKGNKVRDDNKTLQQTGISHEDKLDTLGFTLEPNPAHAPSALCPENPSVLVPCDTTQPLTSSRCQTTPALDQGISNGSYSPVTNLGNFVESDHDSVPSRSDISADKKVQDSKALVAIPTMSMEALSVVPLHRKSRRSELVQRRIRRPFSVSEVEALVQAVEKLGTGRWRDVKIRAFDNAKHRTYVDLKDKWKTLVHTARISPQQRRGEPVPQELLDRVLAAHAYWSKQQAKQQVKQQNEACLLL